jgi:hypothetical protein
MRIYLLRSQHAGKEESGAAVTEMDAISVGDAASQRWSTGKMGN